MSQIRSLPSSTLRLLAIACCLTFVSGLGCGGSDSKQVARPAVNSLAPAPHGLRIDKPVVVPQSYQATLTLDPAKPTFHGEATIELAVSEKSQAFYLNGHGLTVMKASLEAAGETMGRDVKGE